VLLDGSPYSSETPIGTLGSHLLSISAADNAGNVTTQSLGFSVKHATSVAWSGDTTGTFGQTVSLGATLTDTTAGLPIAGAAVDLEGGAQSCSATTDAAGRASCEVTLTSPAGGYSTSASFTVTSTLFGSTALGSFGIARLGTDLSLSAPDSSGPGSVTVNAALTTAGGQPLANQPLVVSAGGPSEIVTTDADGRASLTVDLAAGRYKVLAQFAQTPQYGASSAGQAIVIVDLTGPQAGSGPSLGSLAIWPFGLGSSGQPGSLLPSLGGAGGQPWGLLGLLILLLASLGGVTYVVLRRQDGGAGGGEGTPA